MLTQKCKKIFYVFMTSFALLLILSSNVQAQTIQCSHIYPELLRSCPECIIYSLKDDLLGTASLILHKEAVLQNTDMDVNDVFEQQLKIARIDISFLKMEMERNAKNAQIALIGIQQNYASSVLDTPNESVKIAIAYFNLVTSPYVAAIHQAINLRSVQINLLEEKKIELSRLNNQTNSKQAGFFTSLKTSYQIRKLETEIAKTQDKIESLEHATQSYMDVLLSFSLKSRLDLLNKLYAANLITRKVYHQEELTLPLTDGYFQLPFVSYRQPSLSDKEQAYALKVFLNSLETQQ